MQEIVECVANISEGQNPLVIKKISLAIQSGPQTKLLHVDSGYDANRSVFTFIGDLRSIEYSVHHMFATALDLIDMTKHSGKHPRLGAVDVCPFIPIKNMPMSKLMTWTQILAERLAKTFSIPIYLYEESSSQAHRKSLESIRKGEYEKLNAKMNHPLWIPDFGPTTTWQKSGATVLGARKFLLAYNINLETTDVNVAKQIAKQIRGSGYKTNGVAIPGLFPSVKAIGWYIADFGFAQVSTNLTDYSKCSLHQVYNACRVLAADYGVKLNGSELIGLTPKNPLLMAGKHYNPNEKNDDLLINTAIDKLGLSAIETFKPDERIIENLLWI